MTARSVSLLSVDTEFDDAGLEGWELLSLSIIKWIYNERRE